MAAQLRWARPSQPGLDFEGCLGLSQSIDAKVAGRRPPPAKWPTECRRMHSRGLGGRARVVLVLVCQVRGSESSESVTTLPGGAGPRAALRA